MMVRGKAARLTEWLASGAACVAVLAAGAALAQDAPVTQLQKIEVKGTKAEDDATGPVQGYVAKATTTGSKTATPIAEVPQSVSVIGREELDDRGVVNKVDEALRYTPGVMAEPFGVDPDTDWFYIRGFDASQTGVFLDGLTLFSYGFGGFQVDPFMLERVEVLKGPASVLYGGANPGGIVSLVSKRPLDETFANAETGINSNGNAFLAVDVNRPLNDAISYRVTGKVSGGDNYTDHSEDLRGFILPQVTYQPDDTTSLTVYGLLQGLDQVHTGNGFLPYVGTVVDAPFGKIDRKAFFGEPDIDTGTYVQQMLGYEFKHEFDSGWQFSQNLRYGHLYKHENGPYTYGYYDPSLPFPVSNVPATPDNRLYRLGFEATSKVDTFAVDNRLEGEFETGALDHTLLVGLDYKLYRLDHVQASSAGTPISATNPIYGAPQPANATYINQVVTQQQLGVYAQDQIRFGDGWLVTLNGRYDYVDTKTENGPTFWAPTQNSTFDYSEGAVSGRAGLAYELDNGLTPYVSVATFFNPVVAVTATGNTKPEEGEQFEAGVKYEPTLLDGVLTASIYQLTKRNALVTDPFTSISTQTGEVRSRGIELEGKININESWKVIAGLDFTDLEVTEDADAALVGKTPYLVPDRQASLWIDYTVQQGVFEGVSLGAGVRYRGESWANKENTAKVPSLTVFDAGLRYEKNDWGAALNVTNLFDRHYVSGCSGILVCGYGDARTVTFKLSKKW
ncbi:MULTISPECIES: TonB-dependent siderophore receptor [unclassified Ensifer]|uniref:TonB-dependent siderophore receptor n=1 Tax=unclassified Ensifer TaxID=2633371 RepID=UPI00081300DB|nr:MULTISPECIES: TonB-dependent siderophore receptor [unclassified Ensifer]OCP00611.1 ferrichrome-iron receptor [Ensifer sp. LC14]OCP07835.1 ferrichrome-iron receptor [Ensifer sp. LC11]OCP08603.1 ferrichrome-iron receptor [Ensifer sp. LC13]OCP32105.1 ferrichrome-iron receptor [Ensifer sp. LC499]